jgi:hypothetical protein
VVHPHRLSGKSGKSGGSGSSQNFIVLAGGSGYSQANAETMTSAYQEG